VTINVRNLAKDLSIKQLKFMRKEKEVYFYSNVHNNKFKIAVIGLACNFPGSKILKDFWNNLSLDKESISFFKNEEL